MSVRRALGATNPRLTRLVVTEGLLWPRLRGWRGSAWPRRHPAHRQYRAPPAAASAGSSGRPDHRVCQSSSRGERPAGRARAGGHDLRRARPAWRPAPARRGSAPAGGPTPSGARLVVAEFALALPLLLGTGLLLASFLHLRRVDPGYDPAGVVERGPVTADGALPGRRREAPVLAGCRGTCPRDSGGDHGRPVERRPAGRGRRNEQLRPGGPSGAAGRGAAGGPVVGGDRGYLRCVAGAGPRRAGTSPTGQRSAPGVVLVSRSWAAHYFPGEPVLGQRLIAGGDTENPVTIVGVVGDVKYEGLAGGGEGVYQPISQWTWSRPAPGRPDPGRAGAHHARYPGGAAGLDPADPGRPG